MSYTFSASSQMLTAPLPSMMGSNISAALWAYVTSFAATRCPFSIDRNGGSVDDGMHTFFGNGAATANISANGTVGSTDTNAHWALNGWKLMVMRYEYVSGTYDYTAQMVRGDPTTPVFATTSTSKQLNPSPTTIRVGRYPSSAYWMVGDIAEVSIWDTLLTSDDIVALYANTARKVAADRSLTANLRAYYPLRTDPNYLDYGSDNLTIEGTPTLNSGAGPTLSDLVSSSLPLTGRLMTMNGGMIDLT